MKWWLIFWVMTGPHNGGLNDMHITGFYYEYSTYEKCEAALVETQRKLESLPEFRGAALACQADDPNLRGL